MGEEIIPKTRSLNPSQTLEEILGISKAAEHRNSLSSSGRPPTRHGRDSISSTEENKDPEVVKEEMMKAERKDEETEENGDQDFLNKLNELRRRSLVNGKDVRENEILRLPPDLIKEEEDEAKGNNETLHVKIDESISRPATSNKTTFRIPRLENLVKEEKKEEKKPVRASTAGANKPKPRPSSKETLVPRVSSSILHKSTAHHEAWMKKKDEEEKERKKKEKEEKEHKAQAEERKKNDAKRLFERWLADNNEKLKEIKRKEKEREAKKKVEEEEKKKKKEKEAEQTFEAWKNGRSKSMIDLQIKRKEREKREKERKEKELEEKKKEASLSYEQWLKKKEDSLKEAEDKLKEKIEIEMEKKKADEEYKQLLAKQAYETWLELKMQEEELTTESIVDQEISLPWIPPSNTCPRQFTASGNRRYTLDRRPRAVSAQSGNRMARAGSLKSLRSIK